MDGKNALLNLSVSPYLRCNGFFESGIREGGRGRVKGKLWKSLGQSI